MKRRVALPLLPEIADAVSKPARALSKQIAQLECLSLLFIVQDRVELLPY